MNLALFK